MSFVDSKASRPYVMVYLYSDIYHRPYTVLLNPGEGLATITLRGESFVWFLLLHSVL